MRKRFGYRAIITLVSLIGVVACIIAVAFWTRSYWRKDSISWKYSAAGRLTFESRSGTFAIGHSDPRASYVPETVSWNSYSVEDYKDFPITASRAGFGWYTHAWTETQELHVRYWVLLAFAAFVAAIPWMKWRYSLRMFLLASTVFAVMIGISAASYRQELAQSKSKRKKVEVVYDHGRFSSSVPIRFEAALVHGTEFELLSLDPRQYKATPTNNFYGWMVLGRTEVTDKDVRDRLVAALRGGVNASNEEDSADCFDPRHAIRVKFAAKTFDFLICFECGWIQPYVDSKKMAGFTVKESPQPELDGVLSAAAVELALSPYD